MEVFLAIVLGSLVFNIYKTRKIQNKIKLLESNNEALSEAMLLPSASNEKYIPHSWVYVSTDTIHYNMFSMNEIRMETNRCSKCGLVHRFISSGYGLAQKEGLTNLEGFYRNGIKVSDHSCCESQLMKKLNA